MTLTCKECGQGFSWSKEEQEYYQEKGFKNVPTHCLECRKKLREEREANVPKFEITCSQCDKKAAVPFEPIENQPIYCQNCFDKIRNAKK